MWPGSGSRSRRSQQTTPTKIRWFPNYKQPRQLMRALCARWKIHRRVRPAIVSTFAAATKGGERSSDITVQRVAESALQTQQRRRRYGQQYQLAGAAGFE